MFLVLFTVFCFINTSFANGYQCLFCTLEAKTDITTSSLDQIQALISSASCQRSKHSMGSEEFVICDQNLAAAILPGLGELDVKTAEGSVLLKEGDKDYVHSKGYHYYALKGSSKLKAHRWSPGVGNRRVSPHGKCTWSRDHANCSDACADDRDTICQCRRPQYTFGCSPACRSQLDWMLCAMIFSLFGVQLHVM